MDVAILIRGQSNAWLFSDYGAAEAVRARSEALLGFDGRANRVWLRGGPGRTELGASALLRATKAAPAWIDGDKPGPEERTLLDMLRSMPAARRRVPMLTLWMHNESDSADPALTTAAWVAAVRRDAVWVREVLGQPPAATPYLFVWVPFDFGMGRAATALVDAGSMKIRAGMAALARDAPFDARLAPQTGDLDMDGMGLFCGGLHMSRGDARSLVERLARAVADAFHAYARPGSPEAAGFLANAPAAEAARLADTRAGLVEVRLRLAAPLGTLSERAAAGAGWLWRGSDGAIRAPARVRAEGDRLSLTFGGGLRAPGTLFYGWGHGRLAVGNGCGRGAAVDDARGMGLEAPIEGLAIGR